MQMISHHNDYLPHERKTEASWNAGFFLQVFHDKNPVYMGFFSLDEGLQSKSMLVIELI